MSQRATTDTQADAIVIGGLRRGQLRVAHDRETTVVIEPGTLFVSDYNPRMHLHWTPHNFLFLVLPRKLVCAALRRHAEFRGEAAQVLPARGLVPLLWAQLRLLATHGHTLEADEWSVALSATADVALSVLRHHFGPGDKGPARSHDVLLDSARRYIAQHYERADLTAEEVAAAIGAFCTRLYFAQAGLAGDRAWKSGLPRHVPRWRRRRMAAPWARWRSSAAIPTCRPSARHSAAASACRPANGARGTERDTGVNAEAILCSGTRNPGFGTSGLTLGTRNKLLSRCFGSIRSLPCLAATAQRPKGKVVHVGSCRIERRCIERPGHHANGGGRTISGLGSGPGLAGSARSDQHAVRDCRNSYRASPGSRPIYSSFVLVTLQRNVPTPRYFHGAARRFTTLGPDKRDNWHYVIDIVPQIWFMNQTENCRFFENRSVKDIISTLLGDIGVVFAFRLHEPPTVREYTVQYNETDFACISRLMEEEGYFYFFQHSTGRPRAGHRRGPTLPSRPSRTPR